MEDAKLRKYENTLVISGAAVVTFGLWSIVKAVLYFIMVSPEGLVKNIKSDELAQLQFGDLSENTVGYLLIAVILFLLVLDLLLRLYIGRSAVADGRHLRKKRITYVVMAFLVAAGLVSSLVTRFFRTEQDTIWVDSFETASVSTIVDLTSLLALIEMIIAAIMVRRLRKELALREELQ